MRKFYVLFPLFFTISACEPPQAPVVPESCDTCTGIVTTAVTSTSDDIRAAVLQSDGKLVVAGRDGNNDFSLARYTANGTLDVTFDSDGIVNTDLGSNYDIAFSVLQQSDGKIVAAGRTHNGANDDVAIVRYNSDGSLDTSFDADGIVTTDIASDGDWAYSIVEQSDGKLVVTGYTYNSVGSNYDDFLVIRYNTDGSLDATFDGDGIVTHSLGTTFDDAGYSILQQSDGKLVIAGQMYNGSNYDVAIVRLNSNGSLDTSFDSDGKANYGVGSNSDWGYSMVQQSDGKFVITGRTRTSQDDVLVLRVNIDGSLDTTFDSDGIVTTDIDSSSDYGQSVIQQSDGKIVVAGYGYSSLSGGNDFVVLRYDSDGILDTTFVGDSGAGNGIVLTDIGGPADYGSVVLQQSDLKLVVAGHTVPSSFYDFAVARYNTDGTLDTESFGPTP